MWIEEGTLSDGAERYRIAAGIPRFVKEAEGISTAILKKVSATSGNTSTEFSRTMIPRSTAISVSCHKACCAMPW